MPIITENTSLRTYNTFGINAIARYFSSFSTQDELAQLLEASHTLPQPPLHRPFILGGGSNILFTRNIEDLVLGNDIKGIGLVGEDNEYVYVKAGAGESWHGFVQYCLGRDWAGVENLSLIPGSVGAAPMQNIGAYGVEIKEVFHELEAWDLEDGKVYTFTLNDCGFGYRDSVFKGKYKSRYIILHVIFRLRKSPIFHTEYGAIREELDKMGVKHLSIQAISQAVIRIRTAKLPDPAQLGNAGSFFKNPTIPTTRFTALQAAFPGIVGYPHSSIGPATQPEDFPAMQPAASPATRPVNSAAPTGPSDPASAGTTKLAAGWLIEQCGWKGYRRGDAGCHARQALVLVNYGHATGREIYDLSEDILRSVRQKFGITLEREVNVVI